MRRIDEMKLRSGWKLCQCVVNDRVGDRESYSRLEILSMFVLFAFPSLIVGDVLCLFSRLVPPTVLRVYCHLILRRKRSLIAVLA